MLTIQPDAGRAARRRWLRSKIALARGLERYVLLKSASEDIRDLAPLVAKASTTQWDMAASLDMAAVIGVVIGAWLSAEPLNPDWEYRDRLFLTRHADLITAAAALAIMGFFSPHQAAKLVDQSQIDVTQAIPGLEAPALPPEAIPELAWESALESGKSKRRWRERFGDASALTWADPQWRDSPAVWRTCAIVNHDDAAAQAFRGFPARGGERACGLVVLVTVGKQNALGLAEQWRAEGWEAVVMSNDDSLELYESLTAPQSDRPLAVVLGTGRDRSTKARNLRGPQTRLLGELSDEQFNAIMGETLGW